MWSFIGFGCHLTPPPFLGQWAPNLAERSGVAAESSLIHWFPWQPNGCRHIQKSPLSSCIGLMVGNSYMWSLLGHSSLLIEKELNLLDCLRDRPITTFPLICLFYYNTQHTLFFCRFMPIAESGECTSLTDSTLKMSYRQNSSCTCPYKTKVEKTDRYPNN